MVKRLVAISFLAMVLASCGDEGGDVASETPRSVDPAGWVAFDRGAFAANGAIAFIGVDDDNDPRVGRSDNGKPKAVSPKEIEPTDFAWMPSGRSLLIVDRADDDGDRLAVYDLSGKRERTIPTTSRFRAGRGMAVRSDGAVAIVAAGEPSDQSTYTDLVEVHLATGRTRKLTDTPDVAEDFPTYIDDERVLFGAGQLTVDAGGPNGWIGVLDLNTGAVRRLTPENQAVDSGTVVANGGAAVYVAFPPPDRDQQAMWWVPIGGGEPTKLFPLDGRRPASLGNSNTILYAKTGTPGEPGGLVVREVAPPR